METIKSIWLVLVLLAVFACSEYCCDGAVEVQVRDWYGLERELPTISRAAERNGCQGDDFPILLAVRKAENGRAGCEFGIKDPQAWNTDLNTQAGWAAATIIKNRKRWSNQIRDTPVDFIDFLADRYCPKEDDPQGNKNWKENVRFWHGRFRENSRSENVTNSGL